MVEIHIENPDYVAIKTALRQLASRLEAEVNAANQWSALARNRNIDELPPVLEKVISKLESAAEETAGAANLIAGIQEKSQHEH